MTRFVLVVAAAVFLIVPLFISLYYFGGVPSRPEMPVRPVEGPAVPTPAIVSYLDTYTVFPSLILVDTLHNNNIIPPELNILLHRLSDRGASVEFLRNGGDKAVEILENKLTEADAFIVISPERAYTREEKNVVRRFVETGGRLLLISEPTRKDNINPLATEFGLTFRNDYVYNLKESEGNYRYVRFRGFKETAVTRGLREIVVFTAGSIIPAERGVVFGDEHTFSSIYQGQEALAVAALGTDPRVFALADVTFLAEPYSSYRDNSRFVSNIADFLIKGERPHYLRAFPQFLPRQVAIAYGDGILLDSALTLRSLLTGAGRRVTLGEVSAAVQGGVNLFLFDQANLIAPFLSEAGVTVTKQKVTIERVGEFEREGRAIAYLSRVKSPYTLILAADGQKAMGDLVATLKSGEFRNLLVSDALMVYPIPTPPPTPTATATNTPTPTPTPTATPTR